MPMGNFFGGQGGLPPQQQAPYRRGSDDVQGTDLVAVMQQVEEEKRKRQAQGLLTLVGLAALSNGMDNGQLAMDNGGKKTGGGPGKAGGPVKDAGGMAGAAALLGGLGGQSGLGGQAPAVTGTAKAGGRSRRDSGAAASKPAADASKIFPVAAIGSLAAGAGASGGAGLLSSPVLGASVAGGAALLDGVIGGGDQEEMAKKQIKTGRQESLFGAVAAMTEGLRRRNEERRAAWSGR